MSRVAFILAGGASRGAYQAGCLKRLEEEGIEPELIVGSSIGVCNSLIYTSGGAEALWAFWSRARSLPRILDLSLRRNAIFGNSLFSMDRLVRFVEAEVDFDQCFRSERELTYIVANLSAGQEELRGNRTESSVDRFRTITRIGYSIPILHPLIELDGDLYADGGFLWNVPFEYAEEWGARRSTSCRWCRPTCLARTRCASFRRWRCGCTTCSGARSGTPLIWRSGSRTAATTASRSR